MKRLFIPQGRFIEVQEAVKQLRHLTEENMPAERNINRASTKAVIQVSDSLRSLSNHEVDLGDSFDDLEQLNGHQATGVTNGNSNGGSCPYHNEEKVSVNYDNIPDDDDISPRLLASLQLGPRTTLRGSWGRYYQSHGIQELEVGDGETDFFPAERADQVALGLEHQLAKGVNARIG